MKMNNEKQIEYLQNTINNEKQIEYFQKFLNINNWNKLIQSFEEIQEQTIKNFEKALSFENFKKDIEKEIFTLENIWVKINENWTLDFSNLKENWENLKIKWRNLNKFPSVNFNKENWIWNENWIISTKEELIRLFIFLWFKVNYYNANININEETFYKSELENIIPKLQTIWLKIDEDWVLDFNNIKGYKYWPNLRWKNLTSYPNVKFIRENKIWNISWHIHSKKNLAKLFKILWFNVKKIW